MPPGELVPLLAPPPRIELARDRPPFGELFPDPEVALPMRSIFHTLLASEDDLARLFFGRPGDELENDPTPSAANA
jgi:hypothetical protein